MANPKVVWEATTLQAQYLARLDVLRSYGPVERGGGEEGLLVLGALWRSIEHLSGNFGLEVAAYDASLGIAMHRLTLAGSEEAGEAILDAVRSCFAAGSLFQLQVRQMFQASGLRCHGDILSGPSKKKDYKFPLVSSHARECVEAGPTYVIFLKAGVDFLLVAVLDECSSPKYRGRVVECAK